MNRRLLFSPALTLAVLALQPCQATAQLPFVPITGSTVVPAGSPTESTGPWTLPVGYTQTKLTSLKQIESDPSQSTIRVPGLGSTATMWDMSAFSKDGRYIFIPHETQYGAGVSRYDTTTGATVRMFGGDTQGSVGNWASDYGALDPAVIMPNGNLLVAEEWSGLGRIFEVKNPTRSLTGPDAFQAGVDFVQLPKIPSVSHEGLKFDKAGNMYFIDEDVSGSIYKFAPKNPGDYSSGQTFVLKVGAYAGTATTTQNAASATADRTGAAEWVPMTDANGNALTQVNPFDFSTATRPGRAAADELGGTPYGRPEDLEVGKLANGNEVLYFAATSENAVYAIDLAGSGSTAEVKLTAKHGTTGYNVGYAPTTATVGSPDNLAIDYAGNLYVVEDNPNGASIGSLGGDTWFLRDLDGDGVSESFDHFMGIGVQGAEATGMIFDPVHPNSFIVSVQHPNTTGIAGGEGDSLWRITRTVPDQLGTFSAMGVAMLLLGGLRHRMKNS